MELVIYSQAEGSTFIQNISKIVPDYSVSPRNKNTSRNNDKNWHVYYRWSAKSSHNANLYLFSQMLVGDKEHVLADSFYCAYISNIAAALQSGIQC
jgi:hypothetical protein